jgi:hypothetical protein
MEIPTFNEVETAGSGHILQAYYIVVLQDGQVVG